MLSRALERAGLTYRDIKIVPLEIDEHYRAFIKNKVDAVVTFEPVKSKLLRRGGRIIFDSSQIPNEIVDVLVVEEVYIKKYPDVVQEVVKGWFKALKFWEGNPDKAITVMAKREGLTPEQLKNAFNGIKIPDIKENLTLIDRKNPELRQVAYKLLTVMRTNELIGEGFINIDSLFNGRFIEDK